MLFSSPLFLFLFLPASLGLYFLLRPQFRNLFLLAASLVFYMWGEGTYVLIMIAIIAVNYILGWSVQRLQEDSSSRLVVALAVVANLGLLILFKYSNFLVNQLNSVLAILHIPPWTLQPVHLPLGISFFTFHALSYVIDISRRKVQPGNRWISRST